MTEPATNPPLVPEPVGNLVSQSTSACSTKLGMLAFVCAALGCVGWFSVWLLLQPTDQSEQLARHMTALINTIVMGAIGGPSLLLSVVGAVLSQKSIRAECRSAAQIGFRLSVIGLILAVVLISLRIPEIFKVMADAF